jgi:selenocysteine lyase/cysteine desulfurase
MKISPAVPKSEFNLEGVNWMLHCAEGPVPIRVAEMAHRHIDVETHPWHKHFQTEVLDVLTAARYQAAVAVADPKIASATKGNEEASENITLSQSTSSGLTVVARAFPFKPGDEVLAPLGEFPSNIWPWKALADRGVTFREVPLWPGHKSGRDAFLSTPPRADSAPEQAIAAAIGPHTRIVTVSWVRFQDGLKLDLNLLGRLCRERDVDLVVDGIQGAGTHVPDLTYVSAFATGGHKGLLALPGQGFLWTSPDFRRRLSPIGSWLSVESGGDFSRPVTDLNRSWLDNGQRLEQGGPNVIGSLVLGESLRVLNTAGIANISANIKLLQLAFLDALAAPGLRKPTQPATILREATRLADLVRADMIGPIVSLHHDGNGPAYLDELALIAREHNTYVSTREGYLRVAFHCWHDEDDANLAADVIASGGRNN